MVGGIFDFIRLVNRGFFVLFFSTCVRVTNMKVLVVVFSLFFFACFALSQGLAITQCNEDGFVSVEDRTRDFVLTCANLSESSPTTWFFQGRNATDSSPTPISNCSALDSSADPASWQCSRDFAVTIYAHVHPYTRRSHVILSDVDRGRFPDGSWRCQNGGSVAECAVDVVYTPRDVRCHVTVDEAQGLVEGNCQISRMFSSHSQYGCQWFEKNGNQAETVLPTSQVQFTRSDCSDTYYEYFCGNCSFSKLLPLVSESYRYKVFISPGNLSPAIEINVKSIIDSSQGEATPKDTDMKSELPVTSENPTSLQTTLPEDSPVTVVDEGKVDAARGEGIGIGIAAMLAVAIFVAIVVFVVRKIRHRGKETERNERESSLHAADNPTYDHTRGSESPDAADSTTNDHTRGSEHEYCEILSSNYSNGALPHGPGSDAVSRQPRGISRSTRDMSLTFCKVPYGLDETEQNPSQATPSVTSGTVHGMPVDGKTSDLYLTPVSPAGSDRGDVFSDNSASTRQST